MILKVICEKEAIVYDGFELVRFKSINSDEFNQHTKGVEGVLAVGASWIDSERSLAHSVLIIARPKDYPAKHEFTLATNCVAYLLNDEGKTVERIN